MIDVTIENDSNQSMPSD